MSTIRTVTPSNKNFSFEIVSDFYQTLALYASSDPATTSFFNKIRYNYATYVRQTLSRNAQPSLYNYNAKKIILRDQIKHLLNSNLLAEKKFQIETILFDTTNNGSLLQKFTDTEAGELINVIDYYENIKSSMSSKENHIPPNLQSGLDLPQFPNKPLTPELHLQLGDGYFQVNNFDSAIIEYQSGIELLKNIQSPSNQQIYYKNLLYRVLANTLQTKATYHHEENNFLSAAQYCSLSIDAIFNISSFTPQDVENSKKYVINFSLFMNDHATDLCFQKKYEESIQMYINAKKNATDRLENDDQALMILRIRRNFIIMTIAYVRDLYTEKKFSRCQEVIEANIIENQNITGDFRIHTDDLYLEEIREYAAFTHYEVAKQKNKEEGDFLAALSNYIACMKTIRLLPSSDKLTELMNNSVKEIRYNCSHNLPTQKVNENFDKIIFALREAVIDEIYYSPLQILYHENIMKCFNFRIAYLYFEANQANQAKILLEKTILDWQEQKAYTTSPTALKYYYQLIWTGINIFMDAYNKTGTTYLEKIKSLKFAIFYATNIPDDKLDIAQKTYLASLYSMLEKFRNIVLTNIRTFANKLADQVDTGYQNTFFKLKETPVDVKLLLTTALSILSQENISDDQLERARSNLNNYQHNMDMSLLEDFNKLVTEIGFLKLIREQITLKPHVPVSPPPDQTEYKLSLTL